MLFVLASSLSLLYSSLDPTSVSQHFAFYELYPKSAEGKQALQTAWHLLNGAGDPQMVLQPLDLAAFINRGQADLPPLSEETLAVISRLASFLGNRSLKGFDVWDEKTLLSLPTEEIDLARGLLLAELGNSPETRQRIQSYEANLDLMALSIQARLDPEATQIEKIRAMNDYVFSEMRFRFPPHSLHAKDIDVYTFLPSVLDGRRGVCLGVSILYLSLAQRLHVELEAITPPGHIYVRHKLADGHYLNIETTARGIDVPTERYMGIETRSLHQRSIREVIGLAFMNQAAALWHHKETNKAVALYEKARAFVGDDYLLNMFLGFNYLFAGKEKEGRKLLEKVRGVIPDTNVSADITAEDFLLGKADIEALQAIFSEVDERRSSILQKQKLLEKTVERCPAFRQGWFHLAITWLQLGREKEAIPLLQKYVQMNPKDATAHYYLSAIQFQRRNYPEAWKALKSCQTIVLARKHNPQALTDLNRALVRACPEP